MSDTDTTAWTDIYEEADTAFEDAQYDEWLERIARLFCHSDHDCRAVGYVMPDGRTYVLALLTATEAKAVIPDETVH